MKYTFTKDFCGDPEEFELVAENEKELKIVDIFNDVISSAIYHGGDAGGPYYVNPEGMKESLDKLVNFYNAKDKEETTNE